MEQSVLVLSPLRIQLLTDRAEKAPPVRFTQVLFDVRDVVPGADLLVVGQPVSSEGVFFLPLQEVEAIAYSFFHQLPELFGWEKADLAEGMDLYSKQHLILYDVTYSGKYLLI